MTSQDCHHSQAEPGTNTHVPACHANKDKPDWLLRTCLTATCLLYAAHFLLTDALPAGWPMLLSHSVFELINTIWWGIAIGILMIALLGRVPREFVMSALGTRRGFRGIVRASFAGVLLDLCSHGILMVGAKLYERGASAGQVMAFLVASPWNSLSLTLILIALIGLPWTLAFILLSMVIALVTGILFDLFVQRGVLPTNPQQITIPEGFQFWPEAKRQWAQADFSFPTLIKMLKEGLIESKMVIRWILFGVLLASAVRAFMPVEMFSTYFGPTLMGLAVTIAVATILEVCSEGSTPIAADILTRAGAPGNSFTFLMGGVATDYTEILVLKDATRSLKMALFLPLISVPQVLLLGWLINQTAL
ncbi:MAG: permease [Pseudomonadales bacterium]|nr:permease [Pseudomonadales bacterium]